MRYVIGCSRIRCDYDDDTPMIPSLVVDDHKAVDTGLVSPSGVPIMRVPNPMGFGRNGEWG